MLREFGFAPVFRKGLLCALIVLVSSTLLSGCGSDSTESKENTQEKPAATEAAPDMSRATPVKVSDVQESNVPLYKEFSAQTEAKNTVEIRARVEGFLQTRDFTEGAMVKEGDLLFTIEPKNTQESVNKAQAALTSSKASLKKAQTDLGRYKKLLDTGAISRDEYDQIATTEAEAKAQVQSDEAALKQAQLDLGYTQVKAPISGRIGKASVDIGSLVGSGDNTLLAKISSVDPMYVNFSISEKAYVNFVRKVEANQADPDEKPGGFQLILSDGRPYEHLGEADMIDPEVDASTGTMQARALFPNPHGMLVPGQFVKIRIKIAENQKSLLVPQKAVTDLQGTKMVLIVGQDNKVESRTVTLGARSGSFVIIETGVKAGERIVVEGIQKVKAGDLVKAVKVDMKYTPEANASAK